MLSWINDENGFWCMKVWLHESIKSESNKLSSHRPLEKARKEVALGHKYSKKRSGLWWFWLKWMENKKLLKKKSSPHSSLEDWKLLFLYFEIDQALPYEHGTWNQNLHCSMWFIFWLNDIWSKHISVNFKTINDFTLYEELNFLLLFCTWHMTAWLSTFFRKSVWTHYHVVFKKKKKIF